MTMDPTERQLGDWIKTFVRARTGTDGHAERIQNLATLRKQHLYWEGQQNLRPRFAGPAVVDWQPIPAHDMTAMGAYAQIFNVFRGDGSKLISVLANRAPNVEVKALVEEDETSRRVAAAATRVVQALRRHWDCDEIQREITFLAWTSGTVYGEVEWEQREEFGSSQVLTGTETEEQTVEAGICPECGWFGSAPETSPPAMSPECPQCGAPVRIEAQTLSLPRAVTEERTNGLPRLRIWDMASVIVTPAAKTLEQSPFVIVEEEYYKGDLIAMFPGLSLNLPGKSQVVGDLGVYTRNSLTGKLYYSTVPDPDRWTLSKVWLNPSSYHSLQAQREVGDQLKKQYPQGLLAMFVEGELVAVEASKVTEWLGCGKPSVSRTLQCQSLGYDHLPGQDAVNNYHNIFAETAERNLPMTLIDQQMLSATALRRRPGVSGQFLPVRVDGTKRLSEATYTVQGPKVEPSYTAWAEQVHGVVREIVGVTPALFGGETAHQLTALEADNRLQQALAQLSLVWTGIRKLWRESFTNALRVLVRYGGQALLEMGVTEEDLEMLPAAFDRWGRLTRVAVEVQESIPATPAQIRTALQTAVQAGPPMWQLLQLEDAENAQQLREGLGLRGLVNRREKVRDFLIGRVRILLDGGALPQLEADELAAIDPMEAVGILGDWVVGPEGRQVKLKNPQGYGAVVNWMLEWKQLTLPPSVAGGPLPPGEVAPEAPPPPEPSLGAVPAEPPLPAEGLTVQ